MDAMSLPALKALASAIFDRTFHPVTGKLPTFPPVHQCSKATQGTN